MKKKAWIAVFALLLFLMMMASVFVRLDLDRNSLITKYADVHSRFLHLPGGTIAHVRIAGAAEGPAVVLLHGSMSSLQSWTEWESVLLSDYRVISLDLPGHGLTGPTVERDYTRDGMVAFVHEVLGQLDISQAAFIGHSMGGGVALAYAEQHHGEVSALVLIDANGLPRTAAQGSGLARLARQPILRPVLRWATPRWLIARGLRNSFADPAKLSERLLDQTYDLVRFPGNRAAFIGHYRANDNDALVKTRLGEISTPTLVLWGSADPILPLSLGEDLHRGIRDSKLIVYPGVGHVATEEAAQQSQRDVARFLRMNSQPASRFEDKG
jgi:pimeloyl-ACP methyl ester carboxylesterase